MSTEILLKTPGGKLGVALESDGTTATLSDHQTGATLALANAGLIVTAGDAVNDLTEDSGVIGGTNDGDMPDLATPDADINAAAIREIATTVNALLASLRAAGLIEAGD